MISNLLVQIDLANMNVLSLPYNLNTTHLHVHLGKPRGANNNNLPRKQCIQCYRFTLIWFSVKLIRSCVQPHFVVNMKCGWTQKVSTKRDRKLQLISSSCISFWKNTQAQVYVNRNWYQMWLPFQFFGRRLQFLYSRKMVGEILWLHNKDMYIPISRQ